MVAVTRTRPGVNAPVLLLRAGAVAVATALVVLAAAAGAGAHVVGVLDGAGQPSLRIGPDGVQADGAASRWVALSDSSSWGWYEHRLHETDLVPPPLGFVTPRLARDRQPAAGVTVTLLPWQAPGVLTAVDDGVEAVVRGEAGEPSRQRVAEGQRYGWIESRAIAPEVTGNPEDGSVLATWVVPVEVDGRAAPVRGELRWVRATTVADDADGGGPGWRNVVLAVAGVAAVVALVVVRRRGRGPRT